VDALAGALKIPHELREASRRVGLRRLQTLTKLYSNSALTALHEAIQRQEAQGHHVTVFASACRGLPVGDVLTAYYYQTIAGFCSASLKILRIGQEGTQRVLSACLSDMAAVVEVALKVPCEDIGWFDPALDLASMRHEIAHERLFIS
jgi:urease accessory protein